MKTENVGHHGTWVGDEIAVGVGWGCEGTGKEIGQTTKHSFGAVYSLTFARGRHCLTVSAYVVRAWDPEMGAGAQPCFQSWGSNSLF